MNTDLQEKAVVQATIVFQVPVSSKILMERPHAHGEVLCCQVIHHVGRDLPGLVA